MVVKKNEITSILSVLNCQFKSMKFTHETGENIELPLLDSEVQKPNDGSLLD